MIPHEPNEKLAQATCPLCGKREIISITESERKKAKKEHKLISKAIQHNEEGHIFAIFIDIEGKVRRRYCFEIVQQTHSTPKKYTPNTLEEIFSQMLQNAKRIKKVVQNLSEIELIEQ